MRFEQGHRGRFNVVTLVATVVAAAMCWLAWAGAARAAEAPRWAIMATSTPTDVAAESPRDEVQQVTVDATGGTFLLNFSAPNCGEPFMTSPIAFDATAAEVQGALEATCLGEAVAVSGGPGATSPYLITFTGGHGDQPVPLKANDSGLTGGTHSASVAEVKHGAFRPQIILSATNVGGASTDGSTITLQDVLPPGFVAEEVTSYDAYRRSREFLTCSTGTTVTCTGEPVVDPGDTLILHIKLSVAAGPTATSVVNSASVSGGGAPLISRSTPIAIGETPAAFGPAPGSVVAALSTNRAGAHPNVTTMLELDTETPGQTVGYAKDVRFDLPPGLVGTAIGMPQCTIARVIAQATNPTACPRDTMVGIATLTLGFGEPGSSTFTFSTPVYNIAPAPGEPLAFAFDAVFFPVRLDASVLSNGDYGVRVTAPDIPQAAQTFASSITIWGVPAEHSGPGEDNSFPGPGPFGAEDPGQSKVALLSSPQDCSGSLSATMEADTWSDPGVFVSQEVLLGSLTGCEQVPFGSTFSMLPDTLEAGAPAGYTFKLSVPQANAAEPEALATSNVKDVKVTLPEGTVVNPSAAWGLQACSSEEFDLHSGVPGSCPREAQVGTVEIRTPDLALPLQGDVYLGTPECDPCTPQDAESGRMVRLLVQVVGEGEDGIVVKFEGHGQINQSTGQVTTVFENNPQLPFNELKLTLGGGPRAVLANPRACGPARSELDLTPWSSPFISDSTPFNEFEISQNCFGPQFNPSFTAGTTNIQAGAYSPFTLSFGRSDQDEYLGRLEQTLPPGLLGNIGTVALCREPQAAQGTCPAASLIGHVQVLTGPGADPFLVSGGQVFLTEGYEGAPYGLSIVVPAVAGPYTLAGTTGQGTVVVRAKILVDPTDAHLTVVSDTLPSMLDGIPLQLKVVNVTIDRPGFIFNPTNCGKQQIGGSIQSTQGASANVASSFQVTNCASLAFKPSFSASTSGKTSRLSGASLSVKLGFPAAPQGSEANIHEVKVELPRQLPSQLKTLQKACTAAQFQANPAGCPAASVVGHAKAVTPILPVALEGPAYFVSHGGEAFPSLEVVLQGYGVTVDLTGTTFIGEKSGITSSTFKTVPDVPVSSFQLTLPEGQYPALSALGNLCTSKLSMPTEFVAQNGVVLHQSTKIAVTGCGKTKTKKKKKHEKTEHKHHKTKKAKARKRHPVAGGHAKTTQGARRASLGSGR
jgi:hypothetical protein